MEGGALVQVTAAELSQGESGVAYELARRGLVHVLGTDAHSGHGGRPVRLSGAFECLAEIEAVAPYLDWIVSDAPRAIVMGEEVVPPFDWTETA